MGFKSIKSARLPNRGTALRRSNNTCAILDYVCACGFVLFWPTDTCVWHTIWSVTEPESEMERSRRSRQAEASKTRVKDPCKVAAELERSLV